MTDELDKQNDPGAGGPTPEPDAPENEAPQPGSDAATPSDAPSPLSPLGPDAIADVFSDVAVLQAESPATSPDPKGIKDPSMDFDGPVSPDDPMLVHPAEFPQLSGSAAPHQSTNIDLLLDVKLPVSIELGRTILPISDILNWAQGTIVELDKLAGEPVSLLVNNKLVARGEVVVVDENFGLRITSLVSARERIESL